LQKETFGAKKMSLRKFIFQKVSATLRWRYGNVNEVLVMSSRCLIVVAKRAGISWQFRERPAGYSLRAPHNATSVIGDPAEFRGEEKPNTIRDKKQTRKAMRRKARRTNKRKDWRAI
jgi:hypothetical protein